MSKINFWVELKNRWNAERPLFFDKIVKFSKWSASTSAAIAAIGVIPVLGLPELLPIIAGILSLMSVISGAIANLAVKDPDYSTLDQSHGS